MYLSTHERFYAFLYITLYIKGQYYSIILLYTVSSDSPRNLKGLKIRGLNRVPAEAGQILFPGQFKWFCAPSTEITSAVPLLK